MHQNPTIFTATPTPFSHLASNLSLKFDFSQGGDSSAVKQSGLPNITGWVAIGAEVYKQYVSGAFYIDDDNNPIEGHADGANNGNICFDASKANSIYGSSSIVQPPAIVLIPQLRY